MGLQIQRDSCEHVRHTHRHRLLEGDREFCLRAEKESDPNAPGQGTLGDVLVVLVILGLVATFAGAIYCMFKSAGC